MTESIDRTDEKVEFNGSKILAEIMYRVEVERDRTAKWAQNWDAHTNHSNNSYMPKPPQSKK